MALAARAWDRPFRASAAGRSESPAATFRRRRCGGGRPPSRAEHRRPGSRSPCPWWPSLNRPSPNRPRPNVAERALLRPEPDCRPPPRCRLPATPPPVAHAGRSRRRRHFWPGVGGAAAPPTDSPFGGDAGGRRGVGAGGRGGGCSRARFGSADPAAGGRLRRPDATARAEGCDAARAPQAPPTPPPEETQPTPPPVVVRGRRATSASDPEPPEPPNVDVEGALPVRAMASDGSVASSDLANPIGAPTPVPARENDVELQGADELEVEEGAEASLLADSEPTPPPTPRPPSRPRRRRRRFPAASLKTPGPELKPAPPPPVEEAHGPLLPGLPILPLRSALAAATTAETLEALVRGGLRRGLPAHAPVHAGRSDAARGGVHLGRADGRAGLGDPRRRLRLWPPRDRAGPARLQRHRSRSLAAAPDPRRPTRPSGARCP